MVLHLRVVVSHFVLLTSRQVFPGLGFLLRELLCETVVISHSLLSSTRSYSTVLAIKHAVYKIHVSENASTQSEFMF